MKKLTPFQKKLARWYAKSVIGKLALNPLLEIIGFFLSIIIIYLIISGMVRVFGDISLGALMTEGPPTVARILIVLLLFFSGAIWFSFFVNFDIRAYSELLPETQAKKAEEMINDHPEYAKRIGELIQEAYGQDNGGELKEALEKFKILVGKEKSLADLPIQAEKLKIEITTLGKELDL